MSKKMRKKSSKSAVGRSGSRTGDAKAGTRKPIGAKKSASTAARTTAKKTAKKTAAKSGATSKAAPAKRAATASRGKAAGASRPAAPLNEGDRAPAFTLVRDGGQSVSLSDYAGRKLVIFFYPRADTPGCTLESIAFSRLADAFAKAGTAVLGVSADPLKAQEKFRDKHDLTVPLLSDEKLDMLKAYGVWGEKSLYGRTFMGISRTTVLIDGRGIIVRIWRNVKVDGHADDVLTAAGAT